MSVLIAQLALPILANHFVLLAQAPPATLAQSATISTPQTITVQHVLHPVLLVLQQPPVTPVIHLSSTSHQTVSATMLYYISIILEHSHALHHVVRSSQTALTAQDKSHQAQCLPPHAQLAQLALIYSIQPHVLYVLQLACNVPLPQIAPHALLPSTSSMESATATLIHNISSTLLPINVSSAILCYQIVQPAKSTQVQHPKWDAMNVILATT